MKELLSSLLVIERNYAQRNYSNICDYRTSNRVVSVFCNMTLVRVNAAVAALRHFYYKIIMTVSVFMDHTAHNMKVIQGVHCRSWCNLLANIIQWRHGISCIVKSLGSGDQGFDIIMAGDGLLPYSTKLLHESMMICNQLAIREHNPMSFHSYIDTENKLFI